MFKKSLCVFLFLYLVLTVGVSVAAVPYLGNKTLRDNKITFIKISVERNEGNFEENVFNKIISGFRFF